MLEVDSKYSCWIRPVKSGHHGSKQTWLWHSCIELSHINNDGSINMTCSPNCFHPSCRRQPTVWHPRSVDGVRTNECNRSGQNGVYPYVRHPDKQPDSVCSTLECLQQATVGAGLFVRSVDVAMYGTQSHCGTLASNARFSSVCDVISELLLVTRTFCSARCARFLQGETCHT